MIDKIQDLSDMDDPRQLHADLFAEAVSASDP